MSKNLLVEFGLFLSALVCVTSNSLAEIETAAIANPAFELAALASNKSSGGEIPAIERDQKLELTRDQVTLAESRLETDFAVSRPLTLSPLAYDQPGAGLLASLPSGWLSMRDHPSSPAFHGGMGWPVRNNMAFSVVGQNFCDTDQPDLPRNSLVRGLLEVEFAIYGKISWSF